jgi:hypothetical protein
MIWNSFGAWDLDLFGSCDLRFGIFFIELLNENQRKI